MKLSSVPDVPPTTARLPLGRSADAAWVRVARKVTGVTLVGVRMYADEAPDFSVPMMMAEYPLCAGGLVSA